MLFLFTSFPVSTLLFYSTHTKAINTSFITISSYEETSEKWLINSLHNDPIVSTLQLQNVPRSDKIFEKVKHI